MLLETQHKPTAQENREWLAEQIRKRGLGGKIAILGTARFMAITYPGQHYLWLIHPDEGQR